MKWRLAILTLALCHDVVFPAGPISKFDLQPVQFEFVTARGIFDVERCALDHQYKPIPRVLWQPDRPNQLILIWPKQLSPGVQSRVDVKATEAGTTVRGWDLDDEIIDSLIECVDPVTTKIPK